MSWAEQRTILRGVVGSTAHGLALPGTDDRDEMGVCIEPAERVIGLEPFEQWVYRSAEERDGCPGGRSPRSQAGDLDLTIYSLRKWAKLAAQGNPSVLLLLYVQPTVKTYLGERLQQNAQLFASKQAGYRFLGYLGAQYQRLTGERGGKDVKRPELVERYGYDTKYAMHALRLAAQGCEFMLYGRLTLPMAPHLVSNLMAVRRGETSFDDVLGMLGALRDQLVQSIDATQLPDQPDYEAIDRLLVSMYTSRWEQDAADEDDYREYQRDVVIESQS